MTHYILGTPLIEGNEDSTWDSICSCSRMGHAEHSVGFRLYLDKEKFRYAPIDTLVTLTEVLQKADQVLENTIKKVEKQFQDLGTGPEIKIHTNAGESIVEDGW